MFWRQRLGVAPAALESPTDRPRPHLPSSRVMTLHRHLPEPRPKRFDSLARSRKEPATSQCLLAGLRRSCSTARQARITVVVGSATAGSDRPGAEGGVGLCQHGRSAGGARRRPELPRPGLARARRWCSTPYALGRRRSRARRGARRRRPVWSPSDVAGPGRSRPPGTAHGGGRRTVPREPTQRAPRSDERVEDEQEGFELRLGVQHRPLRGTTIERLERHFLLSSTGDEPSRTRRSAS